MAKAKAIRFDKDGVPVDPNDWTVEDWRTLWRGLGAIKAAIAARHGRDRGTAGLIAGVSVQAGVEYLYYEGVDCNAFRVPRRGDWAALRACIADAERRAADAST